MEGEEEENLKMEPSSNSPLSKPGISTVKNADSVLGSTESQCELQTETVQGGDSGEPLGDSGVRDEEGGEKVSEERGKVGGEIIEEGKVAEGDELDITSTETEVKPSALAEIAAESQKASDLIAEGMGMLPRDGGNDGGSVIGKNEEPAVAVTEPESPIAEKSVQPDDSSGDMDGGIDVAEKEGEEGEAAQMAPSGRDNVVEEIKPDTMVEEQVVGVKKVGEEGSEVHAHVAEDERHSECDKGVEDLGENVRNNQVAQAIKDKMVDDTMDKKGDLEDKAAMINMDVSSGIENNAEVAENAVKAVVVDGSSEVKKEKEIQEEACEEVEDSRENIRDNWVAQGVKDRMVDDATDDKMVEEMKKGGVEDKATDFGISSGIENDVEIAENAARDVAVDGSSEIKKEKEIQEIACENTTAKTVLEDTMDTDAKPYDEAGDVQEDTEAIEDEGIPEEMNVGEDTDAVEEMEIAEDVDMGDEEKMEEGSKSGGTKRKRRRPKAVKKQTEEDVCFICFDGGELVLCDRRFIFIALMSYFNVNLS